MQGIGLPNVEVTSSPNAIGRIPGSSGKAIVFVATLDNLATVAKFQCAAVSLPTVVGARSVGCLTQCYCPSFAKYLLNIYDVKIIASIAKFTDDRNGSFFLNYVIGLSFT